jgi:2,4-dienoyl-CoA reductase-like NADH-dependent reductase (Old Yellow Enzyme family)
MSGVINISQKVFSSGKIGNLTLRNRIIRSGCFEGMCPDASPGDALIEHHRRVAAGGIGMTTVSYCAVSRDGVAFGHEMWMRESIVPALKKLTDAVHKEGAAVSIQLGHCGFFANKSVIGTVPLGPSRKLCLFRYSICRALDETGMQRLLDDFSRAAMMAVEAGFDAVEIHAGHGYLLSQFLSPWTNHRKDSYGGSLQNRSNFPVSVIARVREAVGKDYPVLVKMNCEDGFRGGVTIEEAVVVAQRFAEAGASMLIPSCGFTARTAFFMMRGHVPIIEYVRSEKNLVSKLGMALFGRFIVHEYAYKPLFLFEHAKRIKDAVTIPVAYIGGVCSVDDISKLMASGFEFLQIGRATIKDPDFVKKIQYGVITDVDCDHCNRCVASMAADGVKCLTNDVL